MPPLGRGHAPPASQVDGQSDKSWKGFPRDRAGKAASPRSPRGRLASSRCYQNNIMVAARSWRNPNAQYDHLAAKFQPKRDGVENVKRVSISIFSRSNGTFFGVHPSRGAATCAKQKASIVGITD